MVRGMVGTQLFEPLLSLPSRVCISRKLEPGAGVALLDIGTLMLDTGVLTQLNVHLQTLIIASYWTLP